MTSLTSITTRQKTEPWSLAASPNPPRACLPHILPVLARGPRKNCSNIKLKSSISTALRTGETIPEWKTHNAANSGDRRSCRGETVVGWQTNTPAASSSPLHRHFSQLILVGTPRATETHMFYIRLQGQHWGLRGSKLHLLPHPPMGS